MKNKYMYTTKKIYLHNGKDRKLTPVSLTTELHRIESARDVK